MRNLVFTSSLFLFMLFIMPACNQQSNNKTNDSIEGVYSGVLPCADCAGIETEITLKKDGNYTIKEVYMGHEDNPFNTTGKYTWNNSTKRITLMDGNESTWYLVENKKLVQLDTDGNRISGALANNYILKKK